MIRLTRTESRVLQIVKRWQEEFRNSPGTADLAREMSLSYGSVLHALRALERKGYVQLVRLSQRIMIVPLYWE